MARNKFEEYFDEPSIFSNGQFVVRGDISADEACKRINDAYGEGVEPSDLGRGTVRFGFAPDFVEGMQGELCWYTGARPGKGAKEVWTYR